MCTHKKQPSRVLPRRSAITYFPGTATELVRLPAGAPLSDENRADRRGLLEEDPDFRRSAAKPRNGRPAALVSGDDGGRARRIAGAGQAEPGRGPAKRLPAGMSYILSFIINLIKYEIIEHNLFIERVVLAGPCLGRRMEPDSCTPTSQDAPGRFAWHQRSAGVLRSCGEAVQRHGSTSESRVRADPPANPEGWNLKNQRRDNRGCPESSPKSARPKSRFPRILQTFTPVNSTYTNGRLCTK